MNLDRRTFLAGTSGALSLSLLLMKLMAIAIASKGVPPAPVARVEVVKDTYFGETVSDPYRWMENSKDPDWLPFLKDPMTTAAAIDRLVHHSVIVELNLPSYRMEAATQKKEMAAAAVSAV